MKHHDSCQCSICLKNSTYIDGCLCDDCISKGPLRRVIQQREHGGGSRMITVGNPERRLVNEIHGK